MSLLDLGAAQQLGAALIIEKCQQLIDDSDSKGCSEILLQDKTAIVHKSPDNRRTSSQLIDGAELGLNFINIHVRDRNDLNISAPIKNLSILVQGEYLNSVFIDNNITNCKIRSYSNVYLHTNNPSKERICFNKMYIITPKLIYWDYPKDNVYESYNQVRDVHLVSNQLIINNLSRKANCTVDVQKISVNDNGNDFLVRCMRRTRIKTYSNEHVESSKMQALLTCLGIKCINSLPIEITCLCKYETVKYVLIDCVYKRVID